MKRVKTYKFILILLFTISASYGELVQYSFTGNITEHISFSLIEASDGTKTFSSTTIYKDSEAASGEERLPVTYTFDVDKLPPSELSISVGGEKTTSSSVLTKNYTDDNGITYNRFYESTYFYNNLISGNQLTNLTVDDVSRYNAGRVEKYFDYYTDNTTPFNSGSSVYLQSGTVNHIVTVSSSAESLDDWLFGTEMSGLEQSSSTVQVGGVMYTTLEILKTKLYLSNIAVVSVPDDAPLITYTPEVYVPKTPKPAVEKPPLAVPESLPIFYFVLGSLFLSGASFLKRRSFK